MAESTEHPGRLFVGKRIAEHANGKSTELSLMPENDRPRRSYLSTIFGCWCPRCREGKLFTHNVTFRLKKNMEMYDRCPVCGQPTDIEVGFYYGTGYVS